MVRECFACEGGRTDKGTRDILMALLCRESHLCGCCAPPYQHILVYGDAYLPRAVLCQQFALVVASLLQSLAVQRNGYDDVGPQSAGAVLAREQIAQRLGQSRLPIIFECVNACAQRFFVGSHCAQSTELERAAPTLLAYAGRSELAIAQLAIRGSE